MWDPEKKGESAGMKCIISILMAGSMCLGAIVSAASDDVMTPLELNQVKVGGEIGRRIDITVNNNLLKLDVDRDFFPLQLRSLRAKRHSDRRAPSEANCI